MCVKLLYVKLLYVKLLYVKRWEAGGGGADPGYRIKKLANATFTSAKHLPLDPLPYLSAPYLF